MPVIYPDASVIRCTYATKKSITSTQCPDVQLRPDSISNALFIHKCIHDATKKLRSQYECAFREISRFRRAHQLLASRIRITLKACHLPKKCIFLLSSTPSSRTVSLACPTCNRIAWHCVVMVLGQTFRVTTLRITPDISTLTLLLSNSFVFQGHS